MLHMENPLNGWVATSPKLAPGGTYAFRMPDTHDDSPDLIGTLEIVGLDGMCTLKVGLSRFSGVYGDDLREIDLDAEIRQMASPGATEGRREASVRLNGCWSSVSGKVVALTKVRDSLILIDIRAPGSNRLTAYGPFRRLDERVQVGEQVFMGTYLGEIETLA